MVKVLSSFVQHCLIYTMGIWIFKVNPQHSGKKLFLDGLCNVLHSLPLIKMLQNMLNHCSSWDLPNINWKTWSWSMKPAGHWQLSTAKVQQMVTQLPRKKGWSRKPRLFSFSLGWHTNMWASSTWQHYAKNPSVYPIFPLEAGRKLESWHHVCDNWLADIAAEVRSLSDHQSLKTPRVGKAHIHTHTQNLARFFCWKIVQNSQADKSEIGKSSGCSGHFFGRKLQLKFLWRIDVIHVKTGGYIPLLPFNSWLHQTGSHHPSSLPMANAVV